MPNNRTSRLMDIAGDVDHYLARGQNRRSPARVGSPRNNRRTRRRSRSINSDIHADDVAIDGRKYFDAVVNEERAFDMPEYLTYMNSLPARVANIYPNRSFAQSERLMRGKYVNNRPYLFRRNDVTEAARLYRDMNDYAKYIEHGPGIREATPTLSRSRSRGSRSGGGSSSRSRSSRTRSSRTRSSRSRGRRTRSTRSRTRSRTPE